MVKLATFAAWSPLYTIRDLSRGVVTRHPSVAAGRLPLSGAASGTFQATVLEYRRPRRRRPRHRPTRASAPRPWSAGLARLSTRLHWPTACFPTLETPLGHMRMVAGRGFCTHRPTGRAGLRAIGRRRPPTPRRCAPSRRSPTCCAGICSVTIRSLYYADALEVPGPVSGCAGTSRGVSTQSSGCDSGGEARYVVVDYKTNWLGGFALAAPSR